MIPDEVPPLQAAINSLHGKTVTIKVNVGSEATAKLAEIRAALAEIEAWARDPSRCPARWRGRYNYPDQSIASMTPEQAGEVVESFRMDSAEGEDR